MRNLSLGEIRLLRRSGLGESLLRLHPRSKLGLGKALILRRLLRRNLGLRLQDRVAGVQVSRENVPDDVVLVPVALPLARAVPNERKSVLGLDHAGLAARHAELVRVAADHPALELSHGCGDESQNLFFFGGKKAMSVPNVKHGLSSTLGQRRGRGESTRDVRGVVTL